MAIEHDGSTCPICFEGKLHDGVIKETYRYKGETLEYDQRGAYCDHCGEGIVTGAEAKVVEPTIQAFRARVNQKLA